MKIHSWLLLSYNYLASIVIINIIIISILNIIIMIIIIIIMIMIIIIIIYLLLPAVLSACDNRYDYDDDYLS